METNHKTGTSRTKVRNHKTGTNLKMAKNLTKVRSLKTLKNLKHNAHKVDMLHLVVTYNQVVMFQAMRQQVAVQHVGTE